MKKTIQGKITNKTEEELSFDIIKNNIQTIKNDDKFLTIISMNKKIDTLYNSPRINQIFYNNFTKYFLLTINNKKINHNIVINANNIQNIKKNDIIIFSIYILKSYFNQRFHSSIQKYIKILILLSLNNIFDFQSLRILLEIFLNSILDLPCFNSSLGIFDFKNEPLLFVNDIIESIINYPVYILKDKNFMKEILTLFKNLKEKIKNKNIIIQKDIIWLKILENSLINYKLEDYNKFLLKMYKNQMPKDFFDEIFRKSTIDFGYFLNIMNFLIKINKEEIRKKNKIKRGIKFYGNQIQKQNIKMADIKELTVIFSFYIKTFNTKNEIIIFELFDSHKNSVLKVLIDSDKNIVLCANENIKWNTQIKISKKKPYYLNFILKKKDKAKTFLNIDLSPYNKNRNKNQEIHLHTSTKIIFPNFSEEMTITLGHKEFYGIIGDIIFLKNEIDEKAATLFYKCKDYYPYLFQVENIFQNNFILSPSCKEATNYFKKYQYLYKISYNSFFDNSIKNKNMNIIEHRIISCYNIFLNEKGMEFLIFMLHNINSRIKDVDLLSLIYSEVIDFLYSIMNIFIIKKKRILSEEENFLLINEDEIYKHVNIFFLSLLSIITNGSDRKGKFGDKLWESLKNFLYFKFPNYNSYYNIIISLLLDNQVFDLQEHISIINQVILNQLSNIISFNQDILYKIFALDFIFESEKIKHKTYMNFLVRLVKENQLFQKELTNYIVKLNQEKKIYHYLKLIYFNLPTFGKETGFTERLNIKSFFMMKFKFLNPNHCKYCSYILVLCHLLYKTFLNKEDTISYKFLFKKYGAMMRPSFHFIRAIFIEIFNLENKLKFEFIKTKSKDLYDMSYFDKIKTNPIDLCSFELFEDRLFFLIKYLKLLKSLHFQENIIIIKNFFLMIKEFLEKIQSNNFINDNKINDNKNNDNKNNDNKQTQKVKTFLLKMSSSKAMVHFLILYLIVDKDNALSLIKSYITKPLFFSNFPDSFIFKLLLRTTRKKNKKMLYLIKNEIFNFNMERLFKQKEASSKSKDYIAILFLVMSKNIFDYNIDIESDFHNYYITFFNFLLSNNNYLFENHPIDYNYLIQYEDKNKSEPNDNKNSNNQRAKFIFEIAFEIIFKLYFKGLIQNFEMIISFLKRNNKTIFYIRDEDLLNDKIDKKPEHLSKIYKKDENPCLFSLYFLVVCFNILKQYKEDTVIKKNMEKTCSIIYEDISTLFNKYHKKIAKLKKLENYGQNFMIYNMLCEKLKEKSKKSNIEINVDYLYQKYETFIESYKNKDKQIEIKKSSLAETEEIKSNHFTLAKVKRAKSLGQSSKNKLKDKYFEEPFSSNIKINDFQLNENINITPFEESNKLINNKISDISDIIYNVNIIEQSVIKKTDDYLERKMSIIKIVDIYYDMVLKELNEDEEIIKLLFNPKQYFIWNKFTVILKNLIFYNKKFNKISKAYETMIRITNKDFEQHIDRKTFLKYPTKIRNYITKDYYRPFLKPYLTIFESKQIEVMYDFININLLKQKQFKEDEFNSIKFTRILPPIKKNIVENIIKCELIKNKGDIFGYIAFFENYFIFINSTKDDCRKLDDLSARLDYILCMKDDEIIDEEKYNLFFYSDIKEIIKRRICLYYMGYEIFMKDNRSYLFNFFNKNNLNLFTDIIKKTIHGKNKVVKSKTEITSKMKSAKNVRENLNNSLNNLYNFKKYNEEIKLIEEPKLAFKRLEPKDMIKNNETSNFNYLLLLNKYSSRSYNDCNQYLIFPLLFMDELHKRPRKLGQVLALNKEKLNDAMNKIISNKKFSGYYFNQHYSTSGYVLYYLLRLAPFTTEHIKFQSGKFDLPSRLFNTLKNFTFFFTLANDNRELVPEFFFDYEMFMNLNRVNYGFLDVGNNNYYIDNFYLGGKTVAQYVIELRENLEEVDISPWIDLIFGCRQCSNSEDFPCSFPNESYEEKAEIDKIKKESIPDDEKIKKIQERIDYLKFGSCPSKLFNKPHPKITREKNTNEKTEKTSEMELFEKKKEKLKKNLNKYIKDLEKNEQNFYFINNNATNNMELIFGIKSQIQIVSIKSSDKLNTIKLDIDDQLKLEPYNNSLCEIFPGIYCFVRYGDCTIKIFSQKKLIRKYQWLSIVTAIEPLGEIKTSDEKNIIIKKVAIGDSNGYLHIIKFIYEKFINDVFHINLIIEKSVRTHTTFIKGIIYNERLNIIISWNNEGTICIINDYSLVVLNIIELGKDFDINDILITKYDLIYVNCFNRVSKQYKEFCFTLNGIKITETGDIQKIINCFFDDNIYLVYASGNILVCNSYNINIVRDSIYSSYLENVNGDKPTIKFCKYFPKLKKLLIIYSDNYVDFQDITNS